MDEENQGKEATRHLCTRRVSGIVYNFASFDQTVAYFIIYLFFPQTDFKKVTTDDEVSRFF